MSGHTPGPWLAQRTDSTEWEVVKMDHGEPWFICEVYDNAQHCTAEANATLIAAAPDLLASARALLVYCQAHNWGSMPEPGVTLDNLTNAIAKAEGRQP